MSAGHLDDFTTRWHLAFSPRMPAETSPAGSAEVTGASGHGLGVFRLLVALLRGNYPGPSPAG
jgi:hypothetical protein